MEDTESEQAIFCSQTRFQVQRLGCIQLSWQWRGSIETPKQPGLSTIKIALLELADGDGGTGF